MNRTPLQTAACKASFAMLIAGMALSTRAEVGVIAPVVEATSCGSPQDLTSAGFPCGIPSLAPALGRLPDSPDILEQRGVAEFALPAFSGLERAELQLEGYVDYAWETMQEIPVIAFYGYQGDGQVSEGDLTAGQLLFTASFPATGDYALDVTSFVAHAHAQGWTHVGFGLHNIAMGSGAVFMGANRLVLTAAAIPEPSSVALMGLGLAGMALALRRRA